MIHNKGDIVGSEPTNPLKDLRCNVCGGVFTEEELQGHRGVCPTCGCTKFTEVEDDK